MMSRTASLGELLCPTRSPDEAPGMPLPWGYMKNGRFPNTLNWVTYKWVILQNQLCLSFRAPAKTNKQTKPQIIFNTFKFLFFISSPNRWRGSFPLARSSSDSSGCLEQNFLWVKQVRKRWCVKWWGITHGAQNQCLNWAAGLWLEEEGDPPRRPPEQECVGLHSSTPSSTVIETPVSLSLTTSNTSFTSSSSS